MSETDFVKRLMLKFSRGRVRLFRNNVGEAWQGPYHANPDGSVTITRPRRVIYGLAPGSGDLIGWRSRTITPEMVGHTIAQFLSIEAKAARGPIREAQVNWFKTVEKAGGEAMIVRDDGGGDAGELEHP